GSRSICSLSFACSASSRLSRSSPSALRSSSYAAITLGSSPAPAAGAEGLSCAAARVATSHSAHVSTIDGRILDARSFLCKRRRASYWNARSVTSSLAARLAERSMSLLQPARKARLQLFRRQSDRRLEHRGARFAVAHALQDVLELGRVPFD